MNKHRDTPPLSPEDGSLGRLRWIVAVALAGLIVVGAAFQIGAAKQSANASAVPAAEKTQTP